MQLYVGDYLKDTRHLTAEQHGAYLLLLMSMWAHGGELPSDPKKLARLASCTPARWAKIEADVLEFFEVDGDVITQSRLRNELKKALEKSIIRAEAGMRGGKAKSLKDKGAAVANASDLPCHSSEPEPDTTVANAPVVETRAPKRAGTRPAEPEGFAAFWSAYPRRVAKPEAVKAFAKAVSRITEDDPLALILAGVERALPGWTDKNFIPHPATWLNHDRWNDEAPPPEPTHQRPRNVPSPDRRTAQLDHYQRIFAAMGRPDDRPVEHGRDPCPQPGDEGRMRALPPAA